MHCLVRRWGSCATLRALEITEMEKKWMEIDNFVQRVWGTRLVSEKYER